MEQRLVQTIIITSDPQVMVRGYSLLGREFFLKGNLETREALTIDGFKIVDKYFPIDKKEYLRVVPEAPDYSSDTILIPQYMARLSFRPRYIR
jgi:hypothetical protein